MEEAMTHLATTLINLIHAVFFAETNISSPGFSSPGGALERMSMALADMAQACQQTLATIETGTLHEKNLMVAKKLVSLNQFCLSTLKWARERVQFMTEICCSTSTAAASGSLDSTVAGNLIVQDIIGLVDAVLRSPDMKVVLLAIKRAGETDRYGQSSIRLVKKLDRNDLQDALRLCGWCRLCAVTVRWALDWVSSSMMHAAPATVSDLQSNGRCSIELATDSSNRDGDSSIAVGESSSTSDIDELDASYVFV